MKYIKSQRYFIIYDINDNYQCEVKGYKELANWLGKSVKSVQSGMCRIKKGRIKEVINNMDHKKYKIYEYIEKENEYD